MSRNSDGGESEFGFFDFSVFLLRGVRSVAAIVVCFVVERVGFALPRIRVAFETLCFLAVPLL